jgi:hypothetical protein
LIESPNPYVIAMNVGDVGSPDESIGFSFEHHINDRFTLNAGAVYAHGFLWYFDTNEFKIFNNEFGLVNTWFAFDCRVSDNLLASFKISHTTDFPSTTGIGGYTNEGDYINDVYLLDQKNNFRLQFDYVY